MTADAVLALNRFGIGARPGEVARIAADPRGWLHAQLAQPQAALIADPALLSSDAAARRLAQAQRTKREAAAEGAAMPVKDGAMPVSASGLPADPGQIRRTVYRAEVEARLAQGTATEIPFVERLVLFFANHFAVSVDKGPVHVLAGAFEREAIRPHVLGRFADMLRAVQRHPAMLVYLDNQRSVGPDSPAGARRALGLNENLARETLELHTLGVDGGYGQADVSALARVLTGRGWVPPRADRPDAGQFLFSANRHEPGPQTLLGRTYAAGGLDQGDAVLDALARHPATAHHLARKLATHLVADDPPEGAVARLAGVYRDTDGDLAAMAAALIAQPEAWDPAPRKFKTPYEFVLSAIRLVPDAESRDGRVLRALAAFGQRTFAPPSPRGWPDTAAEWLAPHALKARIDWAAETCERAPPAGNPVGIAEEAFGPLLSAATRREIARAETGAQGLALLLMSPEFQRR